MLTERLGLDGRTVVVAGAGGGGIGTAVCRVLAEAGARSPHSTSTPRASGWPSERSRDAGGVCHARVVDVRDPDGVREAIDALAGLSRARARRRRSPEPVGLVGDDPPETFDAIVRHNLHSAFLTTRAVGAAWSRRTTAGASCTSRRSPG